MSSKILIIDDDELLRKTIRVVLEVAGYEVSDAADGTAGLLEYRTRAADLVLVDMFMPERDGLEVIRALRAEMTQPKIVAMSGGGRTGQLDVLSVAAAFGASRILRKPFEPRELLTVVREVLGL